MSLSISDVEAFPSKQVGVSRPCAWAEECQRATQCREQNLSPGILWSRKEQPALEHHDKRPRKRCPESSEQQQAGTYLKDEYRGCSNWRLTG